MRAHERHAHQFVGRTVQHRFAGVAPLGAQCGDVEHRGTRHVAAAAELDFLGRGRHAIAIGIGLEVGADNQIGRIAADLAVDPVLERIPSAASGVVSRGVLRSDVGVIEDLLIDGRGTGAFGRTEHVALVAAAARRLAVILNAGGNDRVLAIGRAIGITLVAGMTRRRHPDGTVVLGTEADRIITRFVTAYRKVGTDMVCVMIVAVRLVLRNKFGPPRVLRIAGSAAVPRGRESSRGAGIGLPFPVGAELELVVRAGGQPGQRGRLGPRSRRHFLL